ncbi:hypothetical protein ACFSKS_25825 [Pseudocitrobacter faecalis]
MQWISTASQKIDERLYRVCVWVKKYHADAINRVVLTVDLSKARHDPDEDQVRAELLCGHYFLLRKENASNSAPDDQKFAFLPDGRNLCWQTATPVLQHLLLNKNVPESLRLLTDYIHMRLARLTMVPMSGTIMNEALLDSISWVKVDLTYFWQYEQLSSHLGPIQITHKALVRFGHLAKNDENSSAIRILRQRLSSEFLQEFQMAEDELKRKQSLMGTMDVKMLFHAHYPSQKMLVARYKNGWVMVDCFLFHHTKPKKKQKTKLLWLSLNLNRLKEKGVKMELGIMVCIVLLLSVAAAWISNKTVDLLERFYFKRPLSMEYAAWLRVMCAGLLLVFIQVAPQFTLLYTLKLVTLINLGIQTMKLNGVYKYKRTGILPPGGALSNLTRLNPFKKK